MIAPDDYGLAPVATLAHVGDPCRSTRHGAFWKSWSEAVFARSPRLAPAELSYSDPSDPGVTHTFESLGHVQIGCALLEPRTRPLAGLVVLHGYADVLHLNADAETVRHLTDRGLCVLLVRVRGYPGSKLDSPLVPDPASGWITHGLEIAACPDSQGLCNPEAWVLSGAVADAVNACRALRTHVRGQPVFLCGNSFGGGLGVIAASQLSPVEPLDRLAIALPSLGDWPWRLGRRTVAGIDAQVGALITAHRDREGAISDSLRLFDAALHARRVHCPVLCKLATRDEIVPAPAAAAVYNAFATDPGRKWRFVTAYGHFDGGIADARRHALFERVRDDFLDPRITPEHAMRTWEPVMQSGSTRAAG